MATDEQFRRNVQLALLTLLNGILDLASVVQIQMDDPNKKQEGINQFDGFLSQIREFQRLIKTLND